MKKSLLKLSLAFSLLLSVSATFAQAPQKMSFQAVVRNAANTLITSAPVGMRISILQGSATGPTVYIEVQTPTTNINGLVSTQIGSGTVVSGTFAAINWASGNYWVQTETDPAGGTNYTIIGTSQLLSVPYALYAQTAANPGPVGPTGPAGPTGTIGLTGPAGPTGLLTAGAAAGNTPYWNGTTWITNSSNIFNNGGNIGIGNTAPNAALQFGTVISNRRIVLWENFNNDHQFYGFGINNNMIRYQTADVITDHVFYAGVNATTSNELMRVRGNGSVGVGTNNPGARLSVATNAIIGSFNQSRSAIGLTISNLLNTVYTANSDVNDNNRMLSIVNEGATTDSYAHLGFRHNGSTGANQAMLDLKLVNANNGTSRLIYTFGAGGGYTDRFVMTSTGQFGIGTTTPTSPLQVVGLPVFADNAAATVGGLTVGAFYRTATGVVMVRF